MVSSISFNETSQLSANKLNEHSKTEKNGTASSKTETLHPLVLMDPESEKCAENCWKTLWDIAAIASIIAFIALSVVSVIFTGIASGTLYFPFIFLSVGALLPSSWEVYKFFKAKADYYGHLAKIDNAIIGELQQLPVDKEKFKDYLKTKLDIKVKDIHSTEIKSDITKLKFIVAHYLYQEHKAEKYAKKIDKIETKIKNAKDEPTKRKWQWKFLATQQKQALHKVNAAFLYGIMRNPCETRHRMDVCAIQQIPFSDRLLAKEFEAKDYDDFVKIKATNESLKFGEITDKNRKTHELTNAMFEGKSYRGIGATITGLFSRISS